MAKDSKHLQIVVFANCQHAGLANALRRRLPHRPITVQSFLNTSRAGHVCGDDELESIFAQADVLIYQPLRDSHHFSSTRMSRFPGAKLTFPYIFNSGITSLGYAPMSPKASYGEVFGANILEDLFESFSLAEVLRQFKTGSIDFCLEDRFKQCMLELQRRESSCDIRIAHFIEEHYRHQFLFISHNHPTEPVYAELADQVCKAIGERPSCGQSTWLNIDGYPSTGFPYTPYDEAVHRYEFGHHSDWYFRGERLISLVHAAFRGGAPARYESVNCQPFPDANVVDFVEKTIVALNSGSAIQSGYAESCLISIMMHGSALDSAALSWLVPLGSKLRVNHPHYYYYLGILCARIGDLTRAEEAQMKAASLDPFSPDPLKELSLIYNRRGDFALAAKAAQEATGLGCSGPQWDTYLANMLAKASRG